ncbi:MAG: pyrroloquinoline quinone biosynthesis peptide chaperone PqqD [Bauldia sp.]|nr:pyrroloquinoline quinone biosynthesis peptide chaperone PqqD [Bauldia sp.]
MDGAASSTPGANVHKRVVITVNSKPALPSFVRLHHDKARDRWVILVPERVLVPDETAVEIVQMCDGVKTVRDLVDELAKKYNADRALITVDVLAMLQDLADKSFLEDKGATP